MNTRSVRSPTLLLTFLAAGLASGCVVDISNNDINVPNNNFKVSRTFSDTVAMDGRTSIRVVAINGSIELRGDPDATTVIISGERIVGSSSVSDAEDHMNDLRVDITSSTLEVTAITRQPASSLGRSYEVHYVITVPAEFEAFVDQINGAIDVWGPLEDIDVDNTNGTVRAVAMEDDVSIDVANGQIEVAVSELSGAVDLAAVNGTVDITLPTDASADISADVVNGSIQVSGLNLTDQVVTARSLRGTLGGGLHGVDLDTVNGDISIQGS